MKGCSNPIIVGMDFIFKNKVICNHANGSVSFRNGLTSVPFVKKGSYIGIARLLGDEVIPPFRQRQVAVRVKSNRAFSVGNAQGLLTPISHLPNQLQILPTVCSTTVSPMLVLVRNTSHRPIRLRRYGPLCTVAKIEVENKQGTEAKVDDTVVKSVVIDTVKTAFQTCPEERKFEELGLERWDSENSRKDKV